MNEPLKLSLATFQPDKCYPPYLNTPRSLEACRLNGVTPLELVEIPFTEFQKDHPNDLDTANRRFERVDGARRRVLAAVLSDWRRLCQTGWIPPEEKKKPNKESILDVPASAHCKLLEIQAQKFRKIEQDNWTKLQRDLRLEIAKADSQVRYDQILTKHEEIQQQNEEIKQERHAKRVEHVQESIERRREEEEQRMEEIRLQQRDYHTQLMQQVEAQRENEIRERQMREKRLADRVAREQYSQQMKDSILSGIENKMLNRKKMHDIREQNDEQRVKETKERKQRELYEKRRATEQRIQQAREDQRRHVTEMQNAVLERMRESERHRQAVEEARQQNKKLSVVRSEESYERMLAMRQKAYQQAKEKADATLKTLKLREDIAKQELDRVREAQEKRKTIKALRQESFTISRLREQKKEEHRLAKLQKQIQDKEDRLKAIQEGFHVLNAMRSTMKDIMDKTNTEIKAEMNHLRHSSAFSPDRVIEKVMEVSQQVLFPKLERTFGFDTKDDLTFGSPKLFDPNNRHFSFDLGDQPNTTAAFLTEDGDYGDGKNTIRGRTGNNNRTLRTRTPAPTLKIQTLQEDKLKESLIESMKQVEVMHQTMSLSRSNSPNRTRRSSPSGTNKNGDTQNESMNDDENAAILRLQALDGSFEPATTSSPPSALKHRPSSHESPHSKCVGKSALAKSAGEDTHLPMFPFTAGAEFKTVENRNGREEEPSPAKPATAPVLRGSHSKTKKLRNDVNEKAKFLPVAPGKFRREFSSDHPYADGGKGKYKTELQKGLTPTGLPLEPPKKPSNSVEDNVEQAVQLAEKIEKLTYEAQTSVVDEADDIDKIRKEMNAMMKVLLEEERTAEDERLKVLASLKDPQERANIEAIFAEERRRASEKITSASREYDKTIKQAMLKTLKLGRV